jgi:hypothetical protein
MKICLIFCLQDCEKIHSSLIILKYLLLISFAMFCVRFWDFVELKEFKSHGQVYHHL